MAQETEDQLRRGSQAGPGLGHAGQQSIDCDGEGQASVRVGLGIEKQLHVPASIGGDAVEIGHGQVVKVLLGHQDARALIVDVQEVLQVRERVGGADLLHGREGEGDPVASPELEHELRFEAALDMKVQFGLGQAGDEGG